MWRIELLGGPRVIGFGQSITRFESKRAAALLAYLALHPNLRHTREILADRIWPEAPLEPARNRLKQALATLRRQLEPPGVDHGSVIDADRTSVCLREGSFVCDVAEFKAAFKSGDLAKAKALFRGELLPGFYDDWLDDIRAELFAYEAELDEIDSSIEEPVVATPPVFQIQIPADATTFVGREVETHEVLRALEVHRFVSVTGFGGLGKTRVIQQVGRNWGQGDVYFVALSNATSVHQVVEAVIRALGGESVTNDVRDFIGSTPTLLLLDNLEQLSESQVSEVLHEWLEAMPSLRILASSRVPLRGRAECEYRLGPLPVPDPGIDLASAVKNPTVELFIDRARRSRADFQLTPRNADSVLAICARLDGIPLAIELCAAWSHLGVTHLLSKLESEPAFLTSRSSSAEGRHYSLDRVFVATTELLAPSAQQLLGQLTVFRGGWTWELMEQICCPPPSPNSLSELIEVAIVRVDYSQEQPRYSMLESVRQFAERNLEPDERAELHTRFIQTMSSLAASCEHPLTTHMSQANWIAFWGQEWPNLRHAVDLAVANGLDPVALETVRSSEWYWSLYQSDRSMVEAVRHLDDPSAKLLAACHLTSHDSAWNPNGVFDEVAQSSDENHRIRGQALLCKAKSKILRQDMIGVAEIAREAADAFAQTQDKVGQGQALHVLANCFIQVHDRDRTDEMLREAERLFTEAGSSVNLAAVSYTRCRELYMNKDFEETLGALYQCRDVARSLRNMRFMSRTANLFGVVLRNLRQERLARVYFWLSAAACVRVRDERGLHIPLWNLFLSLQVDDRFEPAVPLMAKSMSLWQTYFRTKLDPPDQSLLDEFIALSRNSLGPVAFASLEALGRSMALDETLAFVERTVRVEIGENMIEARGFFGETLELI